MPNRNEPKNTSLIGCLVRLVWMAIGNLILVLCLIGISRDADRVLGVADLIYLATAAMVIGVRYVDIRYYGGTMSSGERATLANWRAYAWQVIGFAGAAWCVVRVYVWLNAAP